MAHQVQTVRQVLEAVLVLQVPLAQLVLSGIQVIQDRLDGQAPLDLQDLQEFWDSQVLQGLLVLLELRAQLVSLVQLVTLGLQVLRATQGIEVHQLILDQLLKCWSC